jgi:tripartite-type tricarboxylate transporter receptor subunit TctC
MAISARNDLMHAVNLVVRTTLAAIAALAAGPALTQNFPSKPLQIITTQAGGGSDFVSRVVAQAIAGPLGQPVVIDNRGGSVTVAGDMLAKAPPDGHLLLLYANAIWLAPFLQDNVAYDPVRDFAPVSLVSRAVNIVVVHPSLPVKSIRDLIALARARPGELNYSSGPAGSPNHLGAELLKAMAGVNITRVPYKGTGPALNAVIGGEVQVMIATVAVLPSHARTGRLRALAVTSAEPSALAPGLPTVAATGVPGYESISIYGLFAPARTPAGVIAILNKHVVQALARPDIRERFFAAGVETAGTSPEQLAATVRSDMARMGKVIREAGIRGE